MIEHLTVKGRAASLLWGYREAALLKTWTIKKDPKGPWMLTALIERVDTFQVRQKPLIFSAPRKGGFWCWPIETVTVGSSQVVARLGLPEQ